MVTPTPLLSGGFRDWDCSGNVIAAYEKAGQYLSETIPENSRVYWAGGNAVAVLTYLPGIHLFPQQVDSTWNYLSRRIRTPLPGWGSGISDLKNQWRAQADVILLQEREYASWQDFVNTGNFNEPPRQEYYLNCELDSYLKIFIRDR